MRNVSFDPMVTNEIPEGVDVLSVPLKVVLGTIVDSTPVFTSPLGNGVITKISIDELGSYRLLGVVSLPAGQIISDTQLVLGISDDPADHIIFTVSAQKNIDIPASGGFSFYFITNSVNTDSSLNYELNSQQFVDSVLNQIASSPSSKSFMVNMPAEVQNATVSVLSDSVIVPQGGSFSFAIKPSGGYQVTSVTSNGSDVPEDEGQYTISDIEADQNVVITVEQG